MTRATIAGLVSLLLVVGLSAQVGLVSTTAGARQEDPCASPVPAEETGLECDPDLTEASPEATPEPPFPEVSAASLLPVDAQVPAGLATSREGTRTIEQMARILAGRDADTAAIATATAQLEGWAWQSSDERQFRPVDGAASGAGGIRWLWVINTRFGNDTNASAAFGALTDRARTDYELRGVGLDIEADEVRGLGGGADGLFHAWLRFGTDVVWVGGTAEATYPRAEVEALSAAIAGNAVTPPAPEIAEGSTVVTIEGANIRELPSTSAAILVTVNAGTVLTIIGPSVDAEGRTWWPVTVVDLSVSGYIAAELITPQA